MIRHWLTPSLGIVLASLIARPATGQTPKTQKEVEEKLAQVRRAQTMDEHIEVFRRLLGRGLTETYPAHLIGTECPGFRAHGQGDPFSSWKVGMQGSRKEVHDLGPVEGVYLKGHGIVYTVTLPPPLNDPLARPSAPAKPPTTPWERELNELRGVKTETKTETRVAPPSQSETIVRLLAENGKHFSELPEAENLSVAVVFRTSLSSPGAGCSSCHQVEKRNLSTPNEYPMTSSSRGPQPPPRNLPKAPETHQELVEQIREAMTLGDLHARQGKHEEATREYLKVEPMVSKLVAIHRTNPEQFTAEARMQAVVLAREMCGKLAQSFVAQGKRDSALSMVRADVQLAQWLESTMQNKAATPSTKTLAVPARMTVTAPKKALDQVGSGKMNLDEFRKAVTIEFAPAPKSAPSDE